MKVKSKTDSTKKALVDDKPNGMASLRTIEKVSQQARLTTSYLVFMAMAGVLAAVALLTDSIPVLIGSMVIAPALPPLGLILLAIVVRKPKLAMRGLTTAFLGFLIAMVFAMITTWLLNVTYVIPVETNLLGKELLDERVKPGWYSVVAAMAAGVAGSVGSIEQKTDTLVGVVAALALVPA